MRQHKSKKNTKDKYTIKTYKTGNYKIDSKRTLQQYTPKETEFVRDTDNVRKILSPS